jgi:hypothetical protein
MSGVRTSWRADKKTGDNINKDLSVTTGCEDGRWIEVSQDHVRCRGLVLAVFDRLILLPQNYINN